ncbi:MAG: MFS transporter [Pseudomonadota bacterium]
MPADVSSSRAETAVPAWLPWLVWGLGCLFFLYGFFQRLAPSVMHDHLMAEFDLTGATVGNLSAFYFYTYATLQVPVGLMVDRFGPRRLLAAGALICSLSTLLFAWSTDATLAHAARAFVGFGAGFSFVCTVTLAARWLPAGRFAQTTGLLMMAGMIGGFLGQAPLAALVEEVGWRPALGASGVVGLALALAIWLVVRDQPPGAPQSKGGALTPLSLLTSLGHVLSRRQNLVTAFISAAMTAPMLSFAGFWGVAWLMQTKGYDRPGASAVTSLLLLGWAVGSPLAGWLSDRLGRRRIVIQAGGLIALVALTAILYLPELPSVALWVLFVVTGAACGCMSVAFALVRGYNPINETGAAFGFVNGAVTATGAVFQPLIGLLLDLGWRGEQLAGARVYDADTFQQALSVLLVFLVVALVASLLLREAREPVP